MTQEAQVYYVLMIGFPYLRNSHHILLAYIQVVPCKRNHLSHQISSLAISKWSRVNVTTYHTRLVSHYLMVKIG